MYVMGMLWGRFLVLTHPFYTYVLSPTRPLPFRIKIYTSLLSPLCLPTCPSPEQTMTPKQDPEGCSDYEMFAYTLNFMFGAGVLGNPFAMANGGIAASILTLLASSSLALLGMIWTVEAIERANMLKNAGYQQEGEETHDLDTPLMTSQEEVDNNVATLEVNELWLVFRA